MAQAAALHLIDSTNANVFVTTTSAPGASAVYKALGQQMFGSPPIKPFPAAPQNIVNLVNYYDWIPRLGRQPGITCISTAKMRVKANIWAHDACVKPSVLQFTGTSDAFGQCFAGPHNQFNPGKPRTDGTFGDVKCCATNARTCGIYVPIEINLDPFFDDDDTYGDTAMPATAPKTPNAPLGNNAANAPLGKSASGKNAPPAKTIMDGGDSDESEGSGSEGDSMENSISSSFKGQGGDGSDGSDDE